MLDYPLVWLALAVLEVFDGARVRRGGVAGFEVCAVALHVAGGAGAAGGGEAYVGGHVCVAVVVVEEEDEEGRKESCGGDGGEDVVCGCDFDAGFESVMGAGLGLHVEVGLAGCDTKWCITGNDGLRLRAVCSLYDHILVTVEAIS